MIPLSNDGVKVLPFHEIGKFSGDKRILASKKPSSLALVMRKGLGYLC
jgi:hypothetical protein